MSNTAKAAAVTPPVAGQNAWGLDADDVNPATYIAVPDGWLTGILRFHADGEEFLFTFGDGALTTVVAANASTIASNAISAQGSVAFKLESDQYVDVDMGLIDLKYKARFAVLGMTGSAGNILRVTRMSGYVR